MAFRMKRIKNEHKMLASAVAKKKLISATWASDSSSVEVEHDAGGPFGILRTKIEFPLAYPTCPPTMLVLDDICHPNVYRGGDGITAKGSVCMSLLDASAPIGVSAEYCWNVAISTPLLVESLNEVLNKPNCGSPADLVASTLYRDDPDAYEATNLSMKMQRDNLREERKVKLEQEEAFQRAKLEDQQAQSAWEREAEIEQRKEEWRQAKVKQGERSKEMALLALPPEPSASEAGVVALRIRTPSGILSRCFTSDAKLDAVFLFLQSHGYQKEFSKLLTSFPNTNLTLVEQSVPLTSLDLHQKTVTLVVDEGGEE